MPRGWALGRGGFGGLVIENNYSHRLVPQEIQLCGCLNEPAHPSRGECLRSLVDDVDEIGDLGLAAMLRGVALLACGPTIRAAGRLPSQRVPWSAVPDTAPPAASATRAARSASSALRLESGT